MHLERKKGIGLILVREILSITGISIWENGVYGEGIRFEMRIPHESYRFASGNQKEPDIT